MDKFELDKAKNRLRFILEDLEALRTVVQDATDKEECDNRGALIAIKARTLESIERDMHEL